MARAKDRPANPAKTAKPTLTKSRKPTKAAPDSAPDTPGMDPVSARDEGGGAELTPEQLYRMIQETAYYKAKARNFAPGHEVQDWIEAEAEVRRRIDSHA